MEEISENLLFLWLMAMGSRARCAGPHHKEYCADGAGGAVSAVTGQGPGKQKDGDKGQEGQRDQGSEGSPQQMIFELVRGILGFGGGGFPASLRDLRTILGPASPR